MSFLRTLWRLLDTRQRTQLVALQLLSIVMGLSTVGGVAAILPFFAALSDPGTIRHNAVAGVLLRDLRLDDVSFVVVLGAAFVASVLVANTINLFGLLAINRFAGRVADTLCARLFGEYLHREYEFHARNSGATLAGRVQEAARVTAGLAQQALLLVTSAATILLVWLAVVLVNPVLALFAVVGLGAGYAAIYILVRARLARNGQIESRHHTERMRTVSEGFGAIKEVTLLRAQDFFVERFAAQSRSISGAATSTLAISQSPKYVLECFTVLCLVGVAVYLRNYAPAQGPWLAQLSFVGFAAYRLLPALQQAFAAIVKLRADRAAFAGIDADLHRPHDPVGIADDRGWHGTPRREIRLCGVTFRYAPDRPAAVSDVSMVIPAGTIVGFMGANGSGKTTLIDLVSGLLLPQAGHLEVDGMRLDRATCRSWQAAIAYVPQQVFLLEATLAENIAFGVPTAQIDQERLEAAVRAACLIDCVAGFPDGYQERLGQGGRALSGGQRQRLAIARALYRDASLLILDEATSALDVASEGEITEMLDSLRANRTILVVAHRTAALRRCDLVFELAEGKIVRSGKYAQLVPVKARVANAG
jgi:ATP-binding cassette, subfamily B, bacterial PglK